MASERRASAPSWFPAGYGVRLLLMLGVLALIGVTIYNLRVQSRRPALPPASSLAYQETVVPDPQADEKEQRDKARKFLNEVEDATPEHPNSPLRKVDMPAYWMLVQRSRAWSFSELEKTARQEPFTKLWNQPQKHRAELVKLRLHVQRVVKWEDAPENPAKVKTTYDVWGWSEDSGTNPYVVVTTELPPGFPEGTDVRAEAVVVGYFLKIMSFRGGDDKLRGAPVVIGRVRYANVPQPASVKGAGGTGAGADTAGGTHGTAPAPPPGASWLITAAATGLLAVVLLGSWLVRLTRRTRIAARSTALPAQPSIDVESWLERFPAEAAAEASPEDRARTESNGSSSNGAAHT